MVYLLSLKRYVDMEVSQDVITFDLPIHAHIIPYKNQRYQLHLWTESVLYATFIRALRTSLHSNFVWKH